MTRSEVRLVLIFALAGAVMPYALYALWQLTLREPPLLTPRKFAILASALCPAARWFYLNTATPFAHDEVVRKLLATVAVNGLLYAAMGVVVAAGLNGRRMLIETKAKLAGQRPE